MALLSKTTKENYKINDPFSKYITPRSEVSIICKYIGIPYEVYLESLRSLFSDLSKGKANELFFNHRGGKMWSC